MHHQALATLGGWGRTPDFRGWTPLMHCLTCLSLRFASFQRRCAPRGPPRKARPPSVRTRVCAADFVVVLTLAFSIRFVLRPNRMEPRGQGSPPKVASLRLAGGALPPKIGRALGRTLRSARGMPVANAAPNISARYLSRRRLRFCGWHSPCSRRSISAPPDPSPWAREAR